ncbi:hypothetical protein Amet_1909 [Alkaliphilus metalliredigens QYMF]|uniref:Uncharacterized protein n=1 Tax=Alkaliphilus metalliredigens (strain QYMF) TaxID=293826 RepID=A6TPF5_ALKMQ|nr:hypothetical protein [Alkaliphilus metalliredigens]ABR48073.1 hypothetical protein Amet_1909 [Alkaliphilus metalliredigens QYMF]
MKKIKVLKSIFLILLLLTLIACGAQRDGNEVIQEPVENENEIENTDKDDEPLVSVERIESYENMEISDWLDENTVIVSKENDSLEKMRLEELSDLYPRSLYSYNINTNEYKLVKEQENIFLGGAVLSGDNKHLLYYGNSLGDPIYYVMNLDTLEAFNIAGAYSANWADNGVVVGGSYRGGAYSASTSGEISPLGDFENESLFIVRKINDRVYYNTNSDTSLMVLDLISKQSNSLNIDNVYDVLPSPEGEQLLVLQIKDSRKNLILCDSDGGNIQILAEGEEIGGVSWSLDQRMIAYSIKDTLGEGIYVYDLLENKEIKIVSDVESSIIHWSPSGEKLVYLEYSEVDHKSSVVYMKYDID